MAISSETFAAMAQVGALVVKGVADQATAASDAEAISALKNTLLSGVERLELQEAKALYPSLREDS